MDVHMDQERWETFFRDAGIESNDVVATYAKNFVDSQIKISMLNDLDRDYLKDMGIITIGHVIAVLRHAKEVYEKAMGVQCRTSHEVMFMGFQAAVKTLESTVKTLDKVLSCTNIQCLTLLKERQHEIDLANIVMGYSYLGEAACVIIDAYDGKRKKTSLKRKGPNMLMDKPSSMNCNLFGADELKKLKVPPTQSQFDAFTFNLRETRHGLGHDAKYQSSEDLKKVFDRMEKSMEHLKEEEMEICKELDMKMKRLQPKATCPRFNELVSMKPYFY